MEKLNKLNLIYDQIEVIRLHQSDNYEQENKINFFKLEKYLFAILLY
jgi:hypothetical protein